MTATDTAAIPFEHPPGQHYSVHGHKLWVEQDGTGEPVLFLSGLGPAGSHVIFHPHFDPLATDYHLIYVDLFGRGRSETPKDLSDITFAGDVADVAALIKAVDCGPCHIYGFSYGGLLAQALGLDHPELVRSVVLANSLYGPEMWQRNHVNLNREIANQHPEIWSEILELRQAGFRSTDPQMQVLFSRAAPSVRFYNPANVAKLANEEGARNTALYPVFCGEDVDFVIGNEIARIPNFLPRLTDFPVPLMVLGGRYDRALYPALQQQVTSVRPDVDVHILEYSGSFSHVEQAEDVHRLLRAFWASRGDGDDRRAR